MTERSKGETVEAFTKYLNDKYVGRPNTPVTRAAITNDLEEFFRDQIARRDFTAKGEQLDCIGLIRGIEREGRDDTAYRAGLLQEVMK